MKDRVPTQPNRVKITHSDGSTEYVTWERADEPTQVGTPLNKETLFSDSVAERFGLLALGADTLAIPSKGFEMLFQELTAKIPASGWSSSPNVGWYTNIVNFEGMLDYWCPIVSLDPSHIGTDNVDDMQVAYAMIKKIEIGNGRFTCYATGVPEEDVYIMMRGV